MLDLYKVVVIVIIGAVLYIEYYFQRNAKVMNTNVLKNLSRTATQHKSNTSSETNEKRHVPVRHKRDSHPEKSLEFYLSNRDKLKKKYPNLFEDLHKKFLTNICPDTVKMTDNERLGECLTKAIEAEIHEIYYREKARLEKLFEVGTLPGPIRKLDPNIEGGIAEGDVPLFHKLLKFRYFKKVDEFSLDFFHRLPLVIKNDIRHHFMFNFKGSYDLFMHERIQYLEEKVDEWILRCANHTRMGLIGQDAFYEDEFLHEISPEVGQPHLLYEVTEMNFDDTNCTQTITVWQY